MNYIQYVDQQYSDTGHGTRASTAENASVEQITIKFLQRSLQQVIGRSNNSYKGIRINNVNKQELAFMLHEIKNRKLRKNQFSLGI